VIEVEGGEGDAWSYNRVRTLIYAQIIIIPSTAKTTKKMTDNAKGYHDIDKKTVRIKVSAAKPKSQ
jgi:hypothetical protein